MLYKLAHIILHKCPRLWEWIEDVNSFLFYLRYGSRLRHLDGQATIQDAQALADFFQRQPENVYTFFHPHAFDIHTLTKLLRRKSMVMHVIYEDNQIIGYCLLRCFFIGKAYRGRIVDASKQGKGLGKALGIWLNEAGQCLQIRIFTTINKNNIASIRAAQAHSTLKPVSEMENGDTLYECIPK